MRGPRSLETVVRELRAAAKLATGNPPIVSIEARMILEYADDIQANDLMGDAALGHKPRDYERKEDSPGILKRLFARG